MMSKKSLDNLISAHCDSESGVIPQRRGIAMLLVIVTVAVVSVIASAYLSSRENAPEIGQNIVASIEARVAADSGLAIAAALLADPAVDLRTDHTAGVLISNYNYGGGTFTITVSDENGLSPTGTTESMRVRVQGTSDGLTHEATASVYIPRVLDGVDVDLSEFAVFANSTMRIDNDAIIGRWSAAPNQDFFKQPIHLGTNSTSPSDVVVSGGATVIDGELYITHVAAASVLSDTSSADNNIQIKFATAADRLPIPASPEDTALSYDDIPYSFDTTPTISSSSTIVHGEFQQRYNTVKVTSGAVLNRTYSGDSIILVNDNFIIDQGARWVINGDLTLTVVGELHLHSGASIELGDGATLRVFVGDTLCVRDFSRLGAPTALAGQTIDPVDGATVYQDSTQCRVYKLDGSAPKGWRFLNRAVGFGQFYAPGEDILMDGDSSIFGSLMGENIIIQDGSTVHYDPTLDTRLGYTNTNCLMYSSSQVLDATLVALATSLDPAVLSTLDSTATAIRTRSPGGIVWEYTQLGLEPVRDGEINVAFIAGP